MTDGSREGDGLAGRAGGLRRWSVAVVVPAHQEGDVIGRCVRSVMGAADAVRARTDDVVVVVVADRCTDATARNARRALASHGGVIAGDVLVIDAGSPAAARAAGVRRALERHGTDRRGRARSEDRDGQDRDEAEHGLDGLWLANTDADTVVPRTWLAAQLDLADAGAAAVAGIVEVDTFGDHPDHVAARWAALYDGPLSEPHPHVHGANLGLRADAYVAAGGWPAVVTGEDHGLWNRVRASGLCTASPRSLVVTTSGRALSRVRGGFADSLNVLGTALAVTP